MRRSLDGRENGGTLDAMEERFLVTQKPDFEKLLVICERWDYRDVPELIDKYLFKDTCPALCLNCGHVEDKSPDTLAGLCDSDTMRSALVLAGIL
jgi:hypothetical protein